MSLTLLNLSQLESFVPKAGVLPAVTHTLPPAGQGQHPVGDCCAAAHVPPLGGSSARLGPTRAGGDRPAGGPHGLFPPRRPSDQCLQPRRSGHLLHRLCAGADGACGVCGWECCLPIQAAVHVPLQDFIADAIDTASSAGGTVGGTVGGTPTPEVAQPQVPTGRRAQLYLGVLVPPLALAIIDPDIFLSALTYAGAYGVMSLFGVLPAVLAWQQRYSGSTGLEVGQRIEMVPGGRPVLVLVGGLALGIMLNQTINLIDAPI